MCWAARMQGSPAQNAARRPQASKIPEGRVSSLSLLACWACLFQGIDMVEETSRARRLIGVAAARSASHAESGSSWVASLRSCLNIRGYCPQFDALIHVMTVESHLYLYGRMKGDWV